MAEQYHEHHAVFLFILFVRFSKCSMQCYSKQVGIAANATHDWQRQCKNDIDSCSVWSPVAALAPRFICLALPACESTGTPMLATISRVLR